MLEPEYGLRDMFRADETPAEAMARLRGALENALDDNVRAHIQDGLDWLVNVHQLEE